MSGHEVIRLSSRECPRGYILTRSADLSSTMMIEFFVWDRLEIEVMTTLWHRKV